MLEDVAVYNVEVDIPYQSWYDSHAKVFDIGPGQMLNWQLNAPHRVENLDTFSVSMTVSYTNDPIRRAEIVNLANGLLRHRFGYQPKSRNLRGPSYFAKAVLQKLYRDSGWVKRQRAGASSDRVPARRRRARQDRRSAEGGLKELEPGNDGCWRQRPGTWAHGRSSARPDSGVEFVHDWKQAAARWNDAQSLDAVPGSALARRLVRGLRRHRSGRAVDRHRLGRGDRRAGRAVAADPPTCRTASGSSNSPISP